jgi:NAD(P)-dependent dehydrogenase (short-subunit alcohol dehydrogenase family)
VRLAGARVLLTGASRGIGKALAEALASDGCEVIGVARSGGSSVRACDVSDPTEVNSLRSETGPVDLLINNAAVIHEPAPIVELDPAEWRRLFDTNVFGLIALLRAYVPAMNARGEGVVVNLSSGWGRIAEANQAPYCATKFSVEAISQALAAEVATGVTVIAVNPGVVATKMLATCFQADVSGYTPPETCAAAFVRMLRKLGPAWNGRSLDVDSF